MTEGFDRRGVELAGSRRSLDCACIGVRVCARPSSKCVLHTNRLIRGKRGVSLAKAAG